MVLKPLCWKSTRCASKLALRHTQTHMAHFRVLPRTYSPLKLLRAEIGWPDRKACTQTHGRTEHGPPLNNTTCFFDEAPGRPLWRFHENVFAAVQRMEFLPPRKEESSCFERETKGTPQLSASPEKDTPLCCFSSQCFLPALHVSFAALPDAQ